MNTRIQELKFKATTHEESNTNENSNNSNDAKNCMNTRELFLKRSGVVECTGFSNLSN